MWLLLVSVFFPSMNHGWKIFDTFYRNHLFLALFALFVCLLHTNAWYQQTHLKLFAFNKLHRCSWKLLHAHCNYFTPALDPFDLCAKCVFNKSARGDEEKERHKKLLAEMKTRSQQDEMLKTLFITHSCVKIKPTVQGSKETRASWCLLSEGTPLIERSSRVVVRALYVA